MTDTEHPRDPALTVVVLCGEGEDPESEPVAASVASVREQSLRAVQVLCVHGSLADLGDVRGRYVVPLRPGETLERDACRNFWEAAERTGAQLAVGRWARPAQPGGKPAVPEGLARLLSRGRVLESADEEGELSAAEAPEAGYCVRRDLLARLPREHAHRPGPTAARRAERIALLPQLTVHRPFEDGADAPRSVLTRVQADPEGSGLLLLAGRLYPPRSAPRYAPRECGTPESSAHLEVELRARGLGRTVTVPVHALRREGGDAVWQTEVRLPAVLRPLGTQDTVWDVRVAVHTPYGRVVTEPTAAPHRRPGPRLPARTRLGPLGGDTWNPYITARQGLALRLEARSPGARVAGRLLRRSLRSRPVRVLRRVRKAAEARRKRLTSEAVKARVYHQVLCRLPVRRRTAVFESHMGKQFSDSPRALYEEVRARGLNWRCHWSYASDPDGFPREARLVRRWSWRYLYALARAELWVDNQGFPQRLAKPRHTTYLQTWHGSAYKLMGWDEGAVKMRNAAARRTLRRAVDRFDYFLVRSEHDVRTLARAYGLSEHKLLRTGYPRNDRLLARDDGGRRDALARRLGVPEGRQVVLYAPTFRQHARDGTGRRGPTEPLLDPARFAERHGHDKVLLVRGHYLDRVRLPERAGDCVLDVSGHHDVTDLLLLADVLVTDYSSVMFDYALLDRPMLLFAPDLEEYQRQRGSYFDLREHAPGPLVRSEAELLDRLSGVEQDRERYAAARREFAAAFGSYDRGGAAASLVERFFAAGSGR
ncbi:CDP-glycerol glycerophosphotransferase family protein [Streptomyces sp. ODS28]|uniref:CDP-glycerol glycerophosphotransferase family protein n=1 Tax=Streptomyces sp. ODS28 TaxID=3136688 RepID=UPI0031E8AD7B